jgi:integral membrane protein
MLNIPEPNMVIGMAHGILFLLYILAVIDLKIRMEWTIGLAFKSLLASIVPFGTFYMENKVFRHMGSE